MAPPGENSEQAPVEERWKMLLNSLGKAPLWRVIHKQPKTEGINAGRSRLLSLPMEILVEILVLVSPLMRYNVILTCKALASVVLGQPALLYPNPRHTSYPARFDFRHDALGAGRLPGQLPLFVADWSKKLPASRLVRQPRRSTMFLITGCYRCCLTRQSPYRELTQVGSRAWMQHLRGELDLIDAPCTRGNLHYTAMELLVWFGDLILARGANFRRAIRRPLTRDQRLEEPLVRFRMCVDEVEEGIDRQLQLHIS